MVGESLGLAFSAFTMPTWVGIAMMGVFLGLALLLFGFPVFLIGAHLLSSRRRGPSAIAQEKERARRILREGRITDADEFECVTTLLAGLVGDREAADLVTGLRDLKDKKEAFASSYSPGAHSGTASVTPPSSTPFQTPLCPSCGAELKVVPKRKKECLACGNYIYVRSTPTGQAKVLVNEQQAAEIDRQWRRYRYRQKKERALKVPTIR